MSSFSGLPAGRGLWMGFEVPGFYCSAFEVQGSRVAGFRVRGL